MSKVVLNTIGKNYQHISGRVNTLSKNLQYVHLENTRYNQIDKRDYVCHILGGYPWRDQHSETIHNLIAEDLIDKEYLMKSNDEMIIQGQRPNNLSINQVRLL